MIEIVRMWSDPSCSIIFHFQLSIEYAGVVELVDSTDLGSVAIRCAGSSPAARTMASVLIAFERL